LQSALAPTLFDAAGERARLEEPSYNFNAAWTHDMFKSEVRLNFMRADFRIKLGLVDHYSKTVGAKAPHRSSRRLGFLTSAGIHQTKDFKAPSSRGGVCEVGVGTRKQFS